MDGQFLWRPNEPLRRRLPNKPKKLPLHERVRQELENERNADPGAQMKSAETARSSG
jgi:hypothetical protein